MRICTRIKKRDFPEKWKVSFCFVLRKRQMRELSKRVTRRKDISKSRKLCLLSVRILLGFAGRYEPGLIGLQAFSSGQQNLLFEDFEGKSGMFLYKR